MTQCLNPDCLKTNPPTTIFCQNCGTKLILAERYRALKIIGQGGFGRTFQAVDEFKPSKPFCVIKQFFPQAQGTKNLEKAAELFAQEAERLDSLGRHSQIPELLAYFTQDNRQYLVQEFIDGQNLQQELEKSGAFDEKQILELLKSLLPVLEFIHSKQVIHRDIKPENIIKRKPDNQFVLVDFGAAKYATMTALAVTGTGIGSAGYVSPEQARGRATFSSDIYSLGVTCICLLTQVEPFKLFDVGEGEWVWRKYLKSRVSDEVGKILDKMILDATNKRFQNVGEILLAINPTSQPQKQFISTPQIFQQSTAESEKGEIFTFEVVTVNNSGNIINRSQKTARQKIQDLGNIMKGEIFSFEVVTVNKSGNIINRTPTSVRQKIENLGNGMKLEMVYIPGGSFLMGSPENEAHRNNNENPQHQVTLQPFYMSKYPITQDQYQAIMGENPSKFKGGNRPVEKVTWHNAVAFCQKLSQKTGKIYRLPSESQWEYACRAGTTTPFYFGETITSELANYNANNTYASEPKGKYRQQTTEVGIFPPNAFGLYDMHGNVLEWCLDVWHENYNNAPTDGSAWEVGGDSNTRVLRGGSWYRNPRGCWCAGRGWSYAVNCNYDGGFRVVCLPGI